MKPSPDDIPELRSALLAYYDRAARDLPWREDRDPYRVLVSEIMLQQTRVETVVGYYGPWLERFPTVQALAEAGDDEVMKAWEGLGYYRRARNLHQAAKAVRERPEGFPSTSDELRRLPGVGEYTAGAVASIVFEEVTPAVDGNVRRVLARLFDEPEPKPAWLRTHATDLVDPDRPGDWNQAVMELGATVCTPRRPHCEMCPVATWCAARAAGTEEERPAPREKKAVPKAQLVLAVLEMDGKVLVERRPEEGLLAGMWAFPEERVADDGPFSRSAVVATARAAAERLGFEAADSARALEAVAHRFSHLDATYLPVVLDVDSTPRMLSGEGASAPVAEAQGSRERRWIEADDAETALPVAQRRVLEAWRDERTTEGV